MGKKIESCFEESGMSLKTYGANCKTLGVVLKKWQQCGVSYSCSSVYKIKHRNKDFHVNSMQAQGRSRGIALHVLYDCTRWLVGGQHDAPATLPLVKALFLHCNGDCLDRGVVLDKTLSPPLGPEPWRVQAVARAMWLSEGEERNFDNSKKETTWKLIKMKI